MVSRHFHNGMIDYAALAELARSEGFDVNTEDAVAMLSTGSDELSDFEMELVSGGGTSYPRTYYKGVFQQ